MFLVRFSLLFIEIYKQVYCNCKRVSQNYLKFLISVFRSLICLLIDDFRFQLVILAELFISHDMKLFIAALGQLSFHLKIAAKISGHQLR